MKLSGIYKITNVITGKCYIGSSKNVSRRWTRHKYDLNAGKHHCSPLLRAWIKYGASSFKWELIQNVQNEQHLIAYEQVFLDLFRSYDKDRGYNICTVANSCMGRKMSLATKEKLAKKNTGKRHSIEAKQKMSESHRELIKDDAMEKERLLQNTEKSRSLASRAKRSRSRRKPCAGYYFNKPRNKWLAQMSVLGKRINLGSFCDEKQAREAYLKAVEANND